MFERPCFQRNVPANGSYSKVDFSSSCDKVIIDSILCFGTKMLPNLGKW